MLSTVQREEVYNVAKQAGGRNGDSREGLERGKGNVYLSHTPGSGTWCESHRHGFTPTFQEAEHEVEYEFKTSLDYKVGSRQA